MLGADMGLDILVEGTMEITYSDFWTARSIANATKESLAEKPLKIVLKDSQKYLSIGYDWAK